MFCPVWRNHACPISNSPILSAARLPFFNAVPRSHARVRPSTRTAAVLDSLDLIAILVDKLLIDICAQPNATGEPRPITEKLD